MAWSAQGSSSTNSPSTRGVQQQKPSRRRSRGTMSTVAAYLPRNNPLLGTFAHAPASGASSAYFRADIVTVGEYRNRLALRHNPYTGASSCHASTTYQHILHDSSSARRASSSSSAAAAAVAPAASSANAGAAGVGALGGGAPNASSRARQLKRAAALERLAKASQRRARGGASNGKGRGKGRRGGGGRGGGRGMRPLGGPGLSNRHRRAVSVGASLSALSRTRVATPAPAPGPAADTPGSAVAVAQAQAQPATRTRTGTTSATATGAASGAAPHTSSPNAAPVQGTHTFSSASAAAAAAASASASASANASASASATAGATAATPPTAVAVAVPPVPQTLIRGASAPNKRMRLTERAARRAALRAARLASASASAASASAASEAPPGAAGAAGAAAAAAAAVQAEADVSGSQPSVGAGAGAGAGAAGAGSRGHGVATTVYGNVSGHDGADAAVDAASDSGLPPVPRRTRTRNRNRPRSNSDELTPSPFIESAAAVALVTAAMVAQTPPLRPSSSSLLRGGRGRGGTHGFRGGSRPGARTTASTSAGAGAGAGAGASAGAGAGAGAGGLRSRTLRRARIPGSPIGLARSGGSRLGVGAGGMLLGRSSSGSGSGGSGMMTMSGGSSRFSSRGTGGASSPTSPRVGESPSPLSSPTAAEEGARNASPQPSPRSNFKPIGVAPAHMHIEDWYKLHYDDVVGEGAFGKILGATRIQQIGTTPPAARGKEYVVKVIKKAYLFSDEERESVVTEAAIHATLVHPHIVRLFDSFESASHVYLVMERVRGLTLHAYMRDKPSFTEAETAVLVKQLLRATEHLHSHGIIHCDIKPQNLLLHKPRDGSSGRYHTVMLCDFGTARRSRDARYFHRTGSVSLVPFSTVTGTMGFVAPEVLRKRHFDSAIDMWSIGVLLYEMLVGFAPFYPYSTCIDEDVDFPERYWGSIGAQARELVAGLLQRDPSKRWSAKAALAHPWMANAPAPGVASVSSATVGAFSSTPATRWK